MLKIISGRVTSFVLTRTGHNNPFVHRNLVVNRFASFRAAVLSEFGKPLQVKEISGPKKLSSSEVRINVEACGVDVVDVLLCKGDYDWKPKLPFVPGFEIAGVVSEVGSKVSNLKQGDRVVSISKQKNGGFAQQCVADNNDIWKLPANLSCVDAAALTYCYSVSYVSLARRANIKKGDLVLVTAVGGGLGLAAIDLAANVYQAKVIGVCGSNHDAELAREKGAWSSMTYNKKDITKAVDKLSKGQGAKIIFDAMGGDNFTEIINCIAHEGTVIIAGFASRIIPSIETSRLLPRSFSLTGVSLSHYQNNANEIYREAVEDVIKMGAEKYIEPTISKTFELEKVNDAFEYILEGRSTGKVIIKMPS